MKNIIIYISIFLTSFHLSAQTITDPELDKFVGTWKWTSSTEEVTITLAKQLVIRPNTGEQREMLVGWHSFTRNGNVVETSMSHLGRDVNIDYGSSDIDLKVTLRGISRGTTSVHFPVFWDLTLHKSCVLDLTLLSGSTTQATWRLKDGNGVYAGPVGTSGAFTLPTNLVLTKQ